MKKQIILIGLLIHLIGLSEAAASSYEDVTTLHNSKKTTLINGSKELIKILLKNEKGYSERIIWNGKCYPKGHQSFFYNNKQDGRTTTLKDHDAVLGMKIIITNDGPAFGGKKRHPDSLRIYRANNSSSLSSWETYINDTGPIYSFGFSSHGEEGEQIVITAVLAHPYSQEHQQSSSYNADDEIERTHIKTDVGREACFFWKNPTAL